MPTISMFYGILIKMFFDDHAPPHFHAEYGEYELVITINPIKITQGDAPKRVKSMVLEWTAYIRKNYYWIGSFVKTCNRLSQLSRWSKAMFYINSIEPNSANYSIKITYDDNVMIIANFKHLMEKGVMTQLKDPAVFEQVQIGNKGRSIIWPTQDIDFCADSLRLKCTQSKAA